MALFVGLMTGTSVDAVDAALVELGAGTPRLVEALAWPIPDALRAEIHSLIASKGAAPASSAWRVDAELGLLYAQAVEALLGRASVGRHEVAAIGCHGQTVLHAPGAELPLTVQLGDPNRIAAATGITVVADFRRIDVALGGEGAPLAPAFHAECLRAGHGRVVLNVGGIANATLLPADPAAPVVGFDTGPGNTLLDAWCSRHLGSPMDVDGAWARGGRVIEALLEASLAEPYFERAPPKSTGRELFDLPWLEKRLAASAPEAAPRDVQRTLCELTALSAARAIERHAPWAEEVLIAGGGSHNPVLMDALVAHMRPRAVATTSHAGVDPDWMEAVAFAWLASRTLAAEIVDIASVTGARRAAVLGALYRG